MSAEIQFDYPTGTLFYATIHRQVDGVWYIRWPAGEVFEVEGTGGRDDDDYAITITDNEDDTYTGHFDTNIKDLGVYVIKLHLTVDGEVCAAGLLFWDGAKEGLPEMISKVYTNGTTLEWSDVELQRNET